MLLSTFELLIKPQLPEDLDPSPPPCEKLSRIVAQGYFLTIANNTSSEAVVSLIFTATTSSVDTDQIFTFVDVAGTNIPSELTQETAAGKIRFTLSVPAYDTCSFILKPYALRRDRELMKVVNLEICGYVEIFVSAFSVLRFNRLLLAPGHQGISSKDLAAPEPQPDQIASTLPTASSESLFSLSNSRLQGLESVLSSQSLDVLNISQLD